MSDPSYSDSLPANAFTELRLSSTGVPPFSCRGASQTLEPISQATQLKRTANAVLKDISFTSFRKYQSSITCEDQEPPAFDDKWPGLVIVVDCIVKMTYRTSVGQAGRPVVPGSSYESGDYTIYRPRLTMRVVSFHIERDEYGAVIKWSLDLEEE